MKRRLLLGIMLSAASLMAMAAADGSWLKKVPQADRERVNPYAGRADAAKAGENLYLNNCAKCHGEEAQGKGSRPTLKSDRVKNATDGELAWILKNGEPFKGMPGWGGLPEQERWQLVTYIRTLNASATAVTPNTAVTQ